MRLFKATVCIKEHTIQLINYTASKEISSNIYHINYFRRTMKANIQQKEFKVGNSRLKLKIYIPHTHPIPNQNHIQSEKI